MMYINLLGLWYKVQAVCTSVPDANVYLANNKDCSVLHAYEGSIITIVKTDDPGVMEIDRNLNQFIFAPPSA